MGDNFFVSLQNDVQISLKPLVIVNIYRINHLLSQKADQRGNTSLRQILKCPIAAKEKRLSRLLLLSPSGLPVNETAGNLNK